MMTNVGVMTLKHPQAVVNGSPESRAGAPEIVTVPTHTLRSIIEQSVRDHFADYFTSEQRYVPEYEVKQISSEILRSVRDLLGSGDSR
jgi:hypothetical protein